jgi:glycine/D-amino acid oxidase-like deaminating enzyme
MRIAVVGGGIFGVTAALALRARGSHVAIYDSELPHPLAESTDISKVVRMDYGADTDYTALGEAALRGWRAWNARWPRPLFHETGVMFVSRTPMQPGGFEHDSFAMLRSRGHALERLDAGAISARFPAWRRGAYVDGYFNPAGGWAESAAVVAQLAEDAEAAGVTIVRERVVLDGTTLLQAQTGRSVRADLFVVCAGAWLPLLVPETQPLLRAVGQPVFHLRPREPWPFEASRFPVFGADIARTGYYGFPANRDGIVKIANHGVGVPIEPGDARPNVTAAQVAALREMLHDTFPELADAPIVARRICVYADTADGDFLIARPPSRDDVVVATGGSGHAFKFAPVLGELIASVVAREPHSLEHRFRWRTPTAGREAARHRS